MIKIIGIFIGWFVLIVGLGFLVKIIFFPVNTAQKLMETAYDAQSKTLNADNAIYNYHWFKQQKEDIDATKEKLISAKKLSDNFKLSAGERKDWTFEDKNESARLDTVALGLENLLTQQIADYNARANMSDRNIFQDGILPNFIDATTFLFKN